METDIWAGKVNRLFEMCTMPPHLIDMSGADQLYSMLGKSQYQLAMTNIICLRISSGLDRTTSAFIVRAEKKKIQKEHL